MAGPKLTEEQEIIAQLLSVLTSNNVSFNGLNAKGARQIDALITRGESYLKEVLTPEETPDAS